jgi:transposase
VRPLPPETRAAIIADLRRGALYSEICGRYQVSKNAVSKIAIKAGLRRGNRQGMLTAAQAAEVVSHYQAGERTGDIAAAFGVSRALIWETLHRSDADARNPGAVPRPLRHDALDVLTPDAAYWCGFIFTDGTIVHRTGIRRGGQPEIAVVLQRRDRDHLVKLRDFLGSTHAITPVAPATVSPNIARPNGGQGTGAFRYSVRSQRLADRLTALGRYGPAVDPALAASCDFWRGCIDGDGTVAISCGIPQVKLVGSHWLLSAFVDFLGPVSSRRPLNVRPARNIYVVSTSYATAEKVIERLYAGASVALDRKAAAAAEILSVQKKAQGNWCAG